MTDHDTNHGNYEPQTDVTSYDDDYEIINYEPQTDVTTYDNNYEIIDDEPQTEPPLDTTERQLIEERHALQSRDALCLSDEEFEIVDDEKVNCQIVALDKPQGVIPPFSYYDNEEWAQRGESYNADTACVAESLTDTKRHAVGYATDDCPPAGVKEKRRKVSDVVQYDRVIIEWCCGHDSMLGRPSTHSDGCEVIGLTIDDDLRTMDGLQQALRIVQDCPRGPGATLELHAVRGG
jgi:hypothetical protein